MCRLNASVSLANALAKRKSTMCQPRSGVRRLPTARAVGSEFSSLSQPRSGVRRLPTARAVGSEFSSLSQPRSGVRKQCWGLSDELLSYAAPRLRMCGEFPTHSSRSGQPSYAAPRLKCSAARILRRSTAQDYFPAQVLKHAG